MDRSEENKIIRIVNRKMQLMKSVLETTNQNTDSQVLNAYTHTRR